VTTFLSRPTLASIEFGSGDSSYLVEAPGFDESEKYLFLVQYSKEVTGDENVSISTPTPIDEFTTPLDGFGFSVSLHNEAETVFTTVPEPGAWALIAGIGLGSLAMVRRGRGRAALVR
jgi:hypothetical protein